ncbi:putative repeat protein (TIGR01451 family), partial [Chitinophaga skermanii]
MKIAIPSKILLLCLLVFGTASALRAQTKYGPYKNTTGAKGTATVNNTAVSDISNVTVNFPAIGLAKAATISGLKSNGTYDVTYTFRVKNYGSAALTGIQVRDTLTNTFPSPLTYSITSITATNGLAATTVANFDGTAAKPGLLNAASSTLAAGATATITVVVNVNAGLNFGTRNNTATAFGNTDNGTVIDVSTNGTDPDADGDGFAFDDATPTPVTINRPDIAITKTVNNATPDVGTNVTFTITAKNEGGDVNAFWVQEVLPSGYEYVTNNPSSGTSYSMGEWYIPNLAAGASKTLTISAKVLASGNYENTAYLKNASTIGDNNATNDTGRISVVPVPVADVSVSKTTTNATPDVGDNATFTITAKNYGLSTAENVSVTESIPAGLTFVSATVSKGTYTGTTWSIGSLAKDEEVTMTFVAKVLGNSTYMNRVDITTSTKESSTTNNAASSTLTPVPVADLAVTKTIDNLTPEVNSDVNFVVTVTNNGLSNATGVIVKDTLMSGYDVVGTIPSKGTYTRSTGTWNIGNLSVGESVTLTIPATVKPSGIYTNTAYVSGNEKDNDVTNNKASAAPTAVIPVADVKISKTVDSTTIDAGNELVFTLTATNDGLSTAHNVVVTDTLPAGYTFVSSTPTNAYNATTGIWAIDSLESGASAELKIRATVKPAGEYLNKAMISATEKDPVLHNNRDSVSVTVVPVVDVAVQKSVNNTTPDVGATVRFTIAATNNGPSTATVVSVEDALPSGYTFVSATASKGAYTAGVWSIGTLTNGETATLTVDATVNPTGDYKNAAQIFVTEKQTNLVNDTASVTPVPVPVTDLAITKTIINATPDAGATITFTLTATNNGPSDATGVKVVDTLLSGYTFLGNTATTGASSYNATTGIWTINSLPSGTSETLTIVATVNPTGDYNNSAIISGNEKESDTTNNKAVITTPVVRPIADLEIVKTVDSTTADAGSEVNFTLTAINHGVSTATNVVVNDVLPTGFTFVSSTSNNYDVSTGVWTIGTLAKDATASITVKALVNASGTYVNTATITATEHDPVTTNNTSSVTVTRVPLVDVAVVKTVNNSTPDVGKNVTFTIKATNAGPSTATNTVVNDALPTGYSLVSATPTAGTYTAGVWTIGTLAKDAEETLTIVATVNATGSYTNTATISATEKEIVTSNNTSSVTPVPVPVAELSIVKTIDNATPDAGSEVVFTVNVTNAGPSTATGVKVTEQLKSGYTYKSSTVTAGTYDAATGIWNIGTQNINITNTLTITAVVNPTGDYSNSAVVEGNEKDTDGSDDESTITTPTVRPIADVAVVKTVDHATADAGSEVNFTLTASNNGVSTATNVVVNDALPSGFTFVSSNSSNYDASTGVWTIGTLANDATASITIKAIVNASGTYVNTATISATEHDPVTTNNTSSVTVTRVPLVDVAVVKTVNNSTPDVGKNVTFTIKATNAGPSDATNTAVNDALPTGYTLVSATPTVGTYTAGVWTIGTLAKDAEETLTVVATVNATGIYTNTATISATEKEIVTNNNTSSVTPVPVPVAELSIVKTIDNATPDAGSEVMFTVNVTNAGPSTATGVTVTEQLKSGYTYKSSTVTAGTYDAATGIWNIGTQSINVTNTLTITAIVNPTGDYNNSASVSGNEKD